MCNGVLDVRKHNAPLSIVTNEALLSSQHIEAEWEEMILQEFNQELTFKLKYSRKTEFSQFLTNYFNTCNRTTEQLESVQSKAIGIEFKH